MSCNCTPGGNTSGRIDYQYAAKIAAGQLTSTKQRILPPGRYDTAINIHNPSRCDTVAFRWKVAVGLPGLEAGQVSAFRDGRLGPDQALEIDWQDIQRALAADGHPLPAFVKGWVVIETPAQLDVVAVYGGADDEKSPNKVFHTERVPPRCMVPCEDFWLNMSTGSAAWTVQPPGSQAPVPATLYAGHPAWARLPGTLWLKPGNLELPGEYIYRLDFKLCSGFQSPELNLSLLGDNKATVHVNGQSVGNPAGFTSPVQVSATGPFHAGDNHVEIRVFNSEGPTGVCVSGGLGVEQGRCPGAPMPILPCPGVSYRVHTADKILGGNHGWEGYVSNGAQAGTTGQSRRVEAMTMVLNGAPPGTTLEYRAHLGQKFPGDNGPYGWTAWTPEGVDCGTTGDSRRMEAIEVRLVNAPVHCHIRYRVHMRGQWNGGWSDWVQDGATAGTTGENRRIEAIQVEIFS